MTLLQVRILALSPYHICLCRACLQVELYSRTKNDLLENNGAVRQILALDSSIVKLTTHGGLLIASTLT